MVPDYEEILKASIIYAKYSAHAHTLIKYLVMQSVNY
jgi:hypothetical protein